MRGGPRELAYDELAAHVYRTTGIKIRRTAMRAFCQRLQIRPYRPTYRYLRDDPQRQAAAHGELAELKKAQAGECIMVSQDEARFPLALTLCTTLGVKDQRPVVGTWDKKDLVYSFAALTVVTGQFTTRLLNSPAKAAARTGHSKTARLQQAFLAHLRDIARAYPATLGKPVILSIDNAPWHQAQDLASVLAAHPQLQLYRLPSYSPQLNLIERLWRVLRRRATHNRLFATMAALRTALRASFCYFSTMRHKVLSLIRSPQKKKEAKSPDA